MSSVFRVVWTTRFLFLFCLICSSANSQQPFYTDDADVTPKGHFHFEFSNQADWLQRSSFPALKQNTADFELDYGIAKGLEIPKTSLARDLLTFTRTGFCKNR